MTDFDKQFLREIANQLEQLANKLAANERPGHVNYISKRNAAQTAYAVCVNLRRVYPLERTGEPIFVG